MTIRRLLTAATAVCAALSAGGVGVTTASAARPACHLVTDPAGDATDASLGDGIPGLPTGVAPNDDHLDILSADLESDGKTVKAVVRLKDVGVDPTSPFVTRVFVTFRVGSHTAEFLALRMQAGDEFYFYGDGSGGRTEGTVDAARKEIRMSVPVVGSGVPVKRGTVFSDVRVRADRWVIYPLRTFPGGVALTADTASTDRRYVVGSRAC